ncbi:histidine phosphatase family protein [Gaetbulibacter sp. M240]|uniref:SixA phosphatase family protein n=1 Tax=Gaetbulibacter sp. M240 TaxID=3126511 RepID=UPI00374F3A7C
MKKIILVRHGKSSWEHDVIDHERPLNNRGILDATRVAETFKRENIVVDLILSSDAKRASTTCNIFVKSLEINNKIVDFNHGLYDFSGESVVKIIKSCSDSVNTLMIFGHNHAFTSIANAFGDLYIENVPTSGLVALDLDIDHWQNLKQGKTILTILPRDIK